MFSSVGKVARDNPALERKEYELFIESLLQKTHAETVIAAVIYAVRRGKQFADRLCAVFRVGSGHELNLVPAVQQRDDFAFRHNHRQPVADQLNLEQP